MAGSAPECKAAGWAAVISSERWLELSVDGETLSGAGRALIRWSDSVLCLDAVDHAPVESGQALVVRLDRSGATFLELGMGSERRQDLQCQLSTVK